MVAVGRGVGGEVGRAPGLSKGGSGVGGEVGLAPGRL